MRCFKLLILLLALSASASYNYAVAQTATLSPTFLDFGCVTSSTTSSPMSFVVTGTYLTPSAGTITVTAPANYVICATSGGTYVTSLTIAYTGGTLSATSIFVEYVAPATSSSSICTDCVMITGGGLSSYVCEATIASVCTSASCTGTPTVGSVSASPATGCGTYSTTLMLGCMANYNGYTYQWQSSPTGSTWTNISGATNRAFTTTISANTYFRCGVTCTASSSTGYSSVLYLINTAAPSVAAITGGTTVSAGASITLTDATAGGTWSTSSATIATVNSSTGVVYGVATGTATISYAVSNSCGTTTVTRTITVTASMFAIGADNQSPVVSIYPNPVSDYLAVKAEQVIGNKVVIRCFSSVGTLITEKTAVTANGNATITLNTKDLPAGIYQVVLQDEQGQKFVNRIVKE